MTMLLFSFTSPLHGQTADLLMTKTVSDATPNVGDTIVFTLLAHNSGPSDATGVSVTDTIPSGFTWVSDNSGGSYNTTTWVWNVGNLANGADTTLQISVSVDSTGNYTNIASVLGNETDPDLTNNADTVKARPPSAFDCDWRNLYEVQYNQLYAMDVINNNFDPIGQPASGNFNGLGYNVNDGLIYGFGTSGDLTNWLISIDTNGVYEKLDSLDFKSSSADTDTTNHLWGLVSSTYKINRIDLSPPYSVVTYTPVGGNPTGFPWDIVYIPSATTDIFYGLSKTSATTANLYTFEITGASSYTYSIKVVSGFTGSTATIFGAGWTDTYDNLYFGHNSSGNIYRIHDYTGPSPWAEQLMTVSSTAKNDGASCRDSYPPFITADLAVVKTVDNATPYIGDTVIFTITVTNNGPDDDNGIYVQDTIPAGYTWVSDDGGGDYDHTTWTWTIGNLVNGASVTLNINAKVNTFGDTMNIATVFGNEFDPVDNNTDSIATVPVPVTDLVMGKTVSDATPNVGDTVVFTLLAHNNGPSDATGVTLSDTIPTGYTYVSDNSGGSYSTSTWTWTVGSLANGADTTLQISVSVGASGEYNNISVVDGNEFDPDTTNNTDSIATVPVPVTDLVMGKTVSDATPNVGDTVVFTLLAHNN
ncbi:MAG: DUF11 domain-containing protein, partial [Bacteroidales bacterium]|nr:DUF11 domain-containing protein [Bacteroidales bacterium]